MEGRLHRADGRDVAAGRPDSAHNATSTIITENDEVV